MQVRHPMDAHVGHRIRQRRWMLGLTQSQLGRRIGLRFQQIHRYETGASPVNASRLWEIAAALQVPISYFFRDGPDAAASALSADAGNAAQKPREYWPDPTF